MCKLDQVDLPSLKWSPPSTNRPTYYQFHEINPKSSPLSPQPLFASAYKKVHFSLFPRVLAKAGFIHIATGIKHFPADRILVAIAGTKPFILLKILSYL